MLVQFGYYQDSGMQATHWLVVAAGDAIGAVLRTLVYEIYSESENAHLFPLLTLTVNILGNSIGKGYIAKISGSLAE